jgi:D-serine deaminase-like pyridoxal phosphate-dependent protein
MITNRLLQDITSPSFVINISQVTDNISFFKNKFSEQNILFRPHFKTHQNKTIAQLFYNEGIRNITLSNLDMVEEFLFLNWESITLAFSFNRLEIPRLAKLAKQININIVVEDIDTLRFIDKELDSRIGVFVKIDVGYNRTGIDWKDVSTVIEILDFAKSSNNILSKGFISHFGNTYHADSHDEIEIIYSESSEKLKSLKKILGDKYGELIISIGDTPSASIINDFGHVDEFRPGNFVYYDWMQFSLGACTLPQISAFIVCPIVAKHSSRNQIVIHGGAVHFSKEYIKQGSTKNYGQLVTFNDDGIASVVEGSFITSLSQEHGIVQCGEDVLENYNIGDLMVFVPIHSCLSANLMKAKTIII